MTGLHPIPTRDDLQNSYEALQNQGSTSVFTANSTVRYDSLALWSQWVRFDPRLGELWIAFVKKHWSFIHPMEFRKAILKQPWPAVVGVLLDQLVWLTDKKQRKLCGKWAELILSDIPAAPHELFFIGHYAIAGKRMAQDVDYSSIPFERWGYFGREIFVNKSRTTRTGTWVSTQKRRSALQALLSTQQRFTTQEYIDFLEGQVSRRQAEIDLSKLASKLKRGKTKGRFFLGKTNQLRGNGVS